MHDRKLRRQQQKATAAAVQRAVEAPGLEAAVTDLEASFTEKFKDFISGEGCCHAWLVPGRAHSVQAKCNIQPCHSCDHLPSTSRHADFGPMAAIPPFRLVPMKQIFNW